MRDAFLLENSEVIKFANVHLLPQHPVLKTDSGKVTRLINIILTNSRNK